MIIKLKCHSIRQLMASHRKYRKRSRTKSSTKTIRRIISTTMFSCHHLRSTITINTTSTLTMKFVRHSHLAQVFSTQTPRKINSLKMLRQVNSSRNIQLTSNCSTFSDQTPKIFHPTFESINCFNTFNRLKIRTVDH